MRCAFAIFFTVCAVATAKQPQESSEVDRYLAAQETGICHVHHVQMARHIVYPSYGLPMNSESYIKATRRFPHWSMDCHGGCLVPDKPEKVVKYVCPECKRLARQWAVKHPKDSMAQAILDETRI
jgi:hypothetical protein